MSDQNLPAWALEAAKQLPIPPVEIFYCARIIAAAAPKDEWLNALVKSWRKKSEADFGDFAEYARGEACAYADAADELEAAMKGDA